MIESIKNIRNIKKIRNTMLYSRVRQYFPFFKAERVIDDRDRIEPAEVVTIDWPAQVIKPKFGIVQDYEDYPRWTKYCRFLEQNSFDFEIYNIHAHDWIENAGKFDIIIGIPSSEFYDLEEMRRKYYVLETFLGKACYPSTDHMCLYEDKALEAYLSKIKDIPFVNTYVSYDKADALHLVETLRYPLICKVNPTSGSIGVELVHTPMQARKIVEYAFSNNGRKTYLNYFRQKNYIYFQDFVPNDGYDIRVIVVGDWVFGYYRKVLEGDFRASGMNLVEKRDLPVETVKLGWKVNKIVKSPMLVVDMLHGLDGKYSIIEFSPVCQMETPEQLHVNGIPGVYIFDDDDSFHFEQGRYWLHELALKEFLVKDYLPKKIPMQ